MPYSQKMEQDFKSLVTDMIYAIPFQEPDDFDSFYEALHVTEDATVSIKGYLLKAVYELKQFIVEGFDTHAGGARVLTMEHGEHASREATATYTVIPAFTSTKSSDEAKIEDARSAFQAIVEHTMCAIATEFKDMAKERRLAHLRDQNARKQAARSDQETLINHPEPQGEARTFGTEEEALRHEYGAGAGPVFFRPPSADSLTPLASAYRYDLNTIPPQIARCMESNMDGMTALLHRARFPFRALAETSVHTLLILLSYSEQVIALTTGRTDSDHVSPEALMHLPLEQLRAYLSANPFYARPIIEQINACYFREAPDF